jgi:hypothetical protein
MESIGKRIFQLEQDEGTIVGQENLKVFITEYYKKLFGAPVPSYFSMREEVTHDIAQLSEEESTILTSPFTEEEVLGAISQMEHNKALGPDGFPAEFYQQKKDVIIIELMALFLQLQNENLPLYKLNFEVIRLLPKKEYESRIEQYRPICLLNVCFKVFSEVKNTNQ